jgi:hypothetical protein
MRLQTSLAQVAKNLLLESKKAVFLAKKRLFIEVRPPGLEPGTKRL